MTSTPLPWVREGFFLLGVTELSGEAAKASREAARKNFWHQRIKTSLPCRRQFPLIDIRRQSLFKKHSKPVLPMWSKIKICLSSFMFTFQESLVLSSMRNLQFSLCISLKKLFFLPQTSSTSHLVPSVQKPNY